MDEDQNHSAEPRTSPIAAPPKGWGRRLWAALPSLVVVLVLVLVILGMLGRIKAKNAQIKAQNEAALKTERPEINVAVLELQPGPITDRMSLPGTLRPFVKLDVLTEIRGEVAEKHVSEGDSVRKGDRLVTIDDADYRLQLASARASYQAALANKERLAKLHRDQLATRAQLDDAVAQVDSLEAAMDSAALNVARCTIEAPLSGVVDALPVEQGQYLNVADPVATVLDVDRLKVEVGIPESDVAAVGRLDQFEITVDALEGKTYSGRRHFLSKTADAMARLYRLEITVDNPEGELLPDMFVRVHIVKKTVPDALTIPLFAVINRDEKHYAYIVNDHEAHLRPVKLGILEGWRIQILSGLEIGQRVIVVGQRSVSEGTPVNVVRTVADAGEIQR